jgi:hypothetical protein
LGDEPDEQPASTKKAKRAERKRAEQKEKIAENVQRELDKMEVTISQWRQCCVVESNLLASFFCVSEPILQKEKRANRR